MWCTRIHRHQYKYCAAEASQGKKKGWSNKIQTGEEPRNQQSVGSTILRPVVRSSVFLALSQKNPYSASLFLCSFIRYLLDGLIRDAVDHVCYRRQHLYAQVPRLVLSLYGSRSPLVLPAQPLRIPKLWSELWYFYSSGRVSLAASSADTGTSTGTTTFRDRVAQFQPTTAPLPIPKSPKSPL